MSADSRSMWSSKRRVSQGKVVRKTKKLFFGSCFGIGVGAAVHAVSIKDWTPPRNYGSGSVVGSGGNWKIEIDWLNKAAPEDVIKSRGRL